VTGVDLTLAKLNRDYFGRREPSVKSHIDRDEFNAIKRFTIKTATSRFNLDLASNKSVSLFEDGQHPDTLPDLHEHEQGNNETPDIGFSKEFTESKIMDDGRVDEFMKTVSQFGIDNKKLKDDIEINSGAID